MVDASLLRERFAAVGRSVNERSRRLFAAAEAKTAGPGRIAAASRATGMARSTSRERYPKMDRLMITADGGGSNGSRVRLFKVELQKLADETGLTLQVCHCPPGTSKWNKIGVSRTHPRKWRCGAV